MRNTPSRPARLLDAETIANVGLYYVCFRLSRYGWNVSPATRNAQGFDLLACSRDASQTRTLQVKATARRGPILLASRLERVVGDFVVVCRAVLTEAPESFLLTPEEARAAAVSLEKDGHTTFWLQPKAYDRPEFREAWSRLGVGASAPGSPNPGIWTPPVKRERVVPGRFVEWFPWARRRRQRETRGRDSSRISGLCVERHADSGP